ncbi:MAG: cytochrome-c oxidase, cbb3-type subunit III [Nitratireductor sp.]|nr:cytochrome-c oxidase, cbb3-type subunit III [Nitratireductor sp.]
MSDPANSRGVTDPKEIAGADPHTGEREIDPVTGYDTTGHQWGPIRELNTPFPMIALVALALAFGYSVIAWFLLPAWPTGRHYTPGLLALDQGQEAMRDFRAIQARRGEWFSRFADPDFASLVADRSLMAEVMPAATRLYHDNCAACHGDDGGGGPGFPNLRDNHWLWGGEPAKIAETIAVGINSDDTDTRVAQMPSFDWIEIAERNSIADYVVQLPSGNTDPASAGGKLFADNCASCHGDGGVGGLDNGAPSLTDHSVIYGQDLSTELITLRHGRQGVMPAWVPRLTVEEVNLLALYVWQRSATASKVMK